MKHGGGVAETNEGYHEAPATAETANRFAEIALGHVWEYPHKLDHVLKAGGRSARASSTRSSSAASTGTAASTATGC
jgi:hypothetical protein